MAKNISFISFVVLRGNQEKRKEKEGKKKWPVHQTVNIDININKKKSPAGQTVGCDKNEIYCVRTSSTCTLKKGTVIHSTEEKKESHKVKKKITKKDT